MRLNVDSVVHVTQAVGRHMLERNPVGDQHRSVAALAAYPGWPRTGRPRRR